LRTFSRRKWLLRLIFNQHRLDHVAALLINRLTVEQYLRRRGSMPENREILGFLTIIGFQKSLGGKAALQQFPYRGSSARHAFFETPRVNGAEFGWRQHDLEALASTKLTHPRDTKKRKRLKVSFLLLRLLSCTYIG
jgi:hypothetical protein